MKFVLKGTPKSKKNNKPIQIRGSKVVVFSSTDFNRYKKSCLEQIKQQLGDTTIPLDPPYTLTVIATFRNKVHLDGDNLLTSICDILQDAGVITNDKFIYYYEVRVEFAEIEESYVEVYIECL